MTAKSQPAFELAYLSKEFYANYPPSVYGEILVKDSRPYAVFLVLIKGVQFAIPFRTTIKHSYCFKTDPPKRCGLDYSKAVVVSKPSYIERGAKVTIAQREYDALKGKDLAVLRGFRRYLDEYRRAKGLMHIKRYASLVEKSSLQYFESYFLG